MQYEAITAAGEERSCLKCREDLDALLHEQHIAEAASNKNAPPCWNSTPFASGNLEFPQ